MPPKKRDALEAGTVVTAASKRARPAAGKMGDANPGPANTMTTRSATAKKHESEKPIGQNTRGRAKDHTESAATANGNANGTRKSSTKGTAKAQAKKATTAKGKTAAKGRANDKGNGSFTVAVDNSEVDALHERAKVEAKVAADQAAEDEEGDNGRSYWLMKAEPESRLEKGVDVKFSIDDLKEKTEPEAWDGVRNPSARNNLRAMRKGDLAFFYHSNCKTPGVVGVMEIVQEHSPDESAFDEAHPYYDPKADRNNPKWVVVHVDFRKKFDELVKLKELQKYAAKGGVLETMQVLKMSRLSVSKVKKMEWDFICELAEIDPVTLESIGTDT